MNVLFIIVIIITVAVPVQMSITEWLDCGVVYKLYESMLRLVKDTENVDQRQNCFLLQTSNGVSRYFSMETKQGLLDVQCAWHRSICTSMMHIKVSPVMYVTYIVRIIIRKIADWTGRNENKLVFFQYKIDFLLLLNMNYWNHK